MPWLLATKKFLYLMTPGKDTYQRRWPIDEKGRAQLNQSWFVPWPRTIVIDPDRATEPEYDGEQPRPTLEQPIPLPPPPQVKEPPGQNPTYLLLTPSSPGNDGLLRFKLEGMRGGKALATWTVFSGTRGAQVIDRPESDWPGSNRPIPHGLYKVGPVEQSPKGNWGPGLGPTWVSLDPALPRNKRSAIGLHQDSNYQVSPGSAGCVVHPSLATITQICDWLSKNQVKYLLVDYGFPLKQEREILGLGG